MGVLNVATSIAKDYPVPTGSLPRVRRRILLSGMLALVMLTASTLALAAMFEDGFEQPGMPPPKGLFHSAGPSRATAPAALDSAASQSDLVSGTLIRTSWSGLHPAAGQFDFSVLDREFERAVVLDTSISLGVLDGFNAPGWLLETCETFTFSFRGEPQRSCLPWDAVYLQHKQALLAALGERFASSPHLAQVYMTYSAMTNGIEMHWRVDEASFSAAGYTPTRLAEAYAQVFDLHVAAFPATVISMEIHEVFGSAALAESAYAHCRTRLGDRCGVAIWWCSERLSLAPGGESSVWPIALDAAQNSLLTCQTLASFTQEPDRFINGSGADPLQTLRSEMAFMYGHGVTHWELWSADVVNALFLEDLQNYADLLER
jgi:hypothetical protein